MPEIKKATAPNTFWRCSKCKNPISVVLVYPVYVGKDKSDREKHMFRCDVCGYFETKTVKHP
jgi:DNA-directed RNA polymerase subunit RPC12/RpoP